MKIETNAAKVATAIRRAGRVASDGIRFDRIGIKANQFILDRTANGIGVDGSEFQEYSDSYKQYKAERLGVSPDVVDLYDSGNMMGSLVVESDNVSATLFFADRVNNDKAATHNEGLDGMPKREFFGLSNDEQGFIAGMMRNDMSKFLNDIT